MLADQMIPVGDGVSLAPDVHRPKTSGRYPFVVVFAAYTIRPVFTDRGYVQNAGRNCLKQARIANTSSVSPNDSYVFDARDY
jgi:predicted acyl esterase